MKWYEKNKTEVLEQLSSNMELGLSSEKIKERQLKHGKNEFAKSY